MDDIADDFRSWIGQPQGSGLRKRAAVFYDLGSTSRVLKNFPQFTRNKFLSARHTIRTSIAVNTSSPSAITSVMMG